jgi:hypothetical protein
MNVSEKEPDNEPDIEIPASTLHETSPKDLEPLLKPAFVRGRPKKTDEEKAITRRANLDRRNDRAKSRREAEKTLKQLSERNENPVIADFSATKNNRVDSVINPSIDPLYEKKIEYEKKLLDKKYLIEDARLDLYLKNMHQQPAQEPKPKKERAPRKPREPKPKPAQIAVPKQDISVADQIFNLYK